MDSTAPSPAKKRALIAEDDETFRKVLRNAIELLGFEVREAENGKVAKTIFDLNTNALDLIVSDIRMPEMDGVTFLKHVRSLNKNVKFVLMTGFAEVIEAAQAQALGANEFLAKPFRLETIRKAIKACFDTSPKDQSKDGPEPPPTFCRIPVEEFITSSKLVCDLYVHLANERYIKIAHAGDFIEVDRLKTYREKKVDFFYVRQEELRKLVGLNLQVSKVANASTKLKAETRLKVLASTAALISQSFYYDGVDKQHLDEAKQVIDNALSIVVDDSNFMALFSFLQSEGDQMYSHAVAISMYSCMIAKKLGHTSQTTQIRLALGGLMHDIGKKELPLNVISKTRIEMGAAEIKLYETHPQRGKDILATVPGIPDDVLQIVAHHHENNVGTGFPYHLIANRIHPLAKIVAVADCFFNTVHRMGGKDKVGIQTAIRKMAVIHSQEYDPNVMRALAELFGVSWPVNAKAS